MFGLMGMELNTALFCHRTAPFFENNQFSWVGPNPQTLPPEKYTYMMQFISIYYSSTYLDFFLWSYIWQHK